MTAAPVDMTLTTEERLARIEERLPVPENVGPEWIAQKLGISGSYLRKAKYLLPNFGVSDVPGRLLWSLRLVGSWYQTSLRDLEAQWNQLPESRKKAITQGWSK